MQICKHKRLLYEFAENLSVNLLKWFSKRDGEIKLNAFLFDALSTVLKLLNTKYLPETPLISFNINRVQRSM